MIIMSVMNLSFESLNHFEAGMNFTIVLKHKVHFYAGINFNTMFSATIADKQFR